MFKHFNVGKRKLDPNSSSISNNNVKLVMDRGFTCRYVTTSFHNVHLGHKLLDYLGQRMRIVFATYAQPLNMGQRT